MRNLFCVTFSFIQLVCLSESWINAPNDADSCTNRREFTASAVSAIASSSSSILLPSAVNAVAVNTDSLASRLSKKDPSVLVNSIFNIPPTSQVFPEFMRGSWDMTCKYGGYLFPSQKISRERLAKNFQIPGFQKCSIVAVSDVGKETVGYTMKIDEKTGLEDRKVTLMSQINANLGYSSVTDILYNPKSNPNRLSIDFVEYRTKNAERVELFFNARESQFVPETGTFVCSEHARQVTFGTGSEPGVPRQVTTNYAHFWTWKKNSNNPSILTGNLLTAAFLDPQDPMFFEEPSKPVAVFSHILSGVKT